MEGIVSVDEVIWEETSNFQEVVVFKSNDFGLCLALDGVLQSTEQDEHIYHEYLVHVPLALHPAPQHVLICGGGNGAAAREALKHETVERVVIAEVDEAVVTTARKFLPKQSCAFDDPRVTTSIGDAALLLAGETGPFDIIIIDGTDEGLTNGHSNHLWEAGFYKACFAKLNVGGLLATQLGACLPQEDGGLAWTEEAPEAVARLRRAGFADVSCYLAEVPSYGGLALFAVAACHGQSKLDSFVLEERVSSRKLDTTCYSAKGHVAAFQLPLPLQAAFAAR